MIRNSAKALRAAAIAIPALLATSVALPASAQVGISIGFNSFHDRLSPYGRWINDSRWGRVWQPRVSRNFRPYYDGRWVNTREYGWLWVSNERFGDITYHYGRWVSDPRRGWLWVPGYVWAPSWVIWRSGGGEIAWFPMPPGDNYYGQGAYNGSFQNRYGYSDWYGASFDDNRFLSLWIVVGQDHFADRNYRSYVTPQRNFGSFASQTRDFTSYATVNDHVVNRGIDTALPTANPRFAPVAARSVIGNSALVTPATVGRQVDQRERQQQPANAGPANPAIQQGSADTRGNQGRGNNPPAAASSPRLAPQQSPAAATRSQPAAAAPSAAQAPAAPPETRSNRGRGNDQPAATTPVETRGNRDRGSNQPPAAPSQPAAAAPSAAQAPAASPEIRGNRGRGNDQNTPQPPAAAPSAAAAPAAAPPAEGRGGRANPPDAPRDDKKKKDDNSGDSPGRGGN